MVTGDHGRSPLYEGACYLKGNSPLRANALIIEDRITASGMYAVRSPKRRQCENKITTCFVQNLITVSEDVKTVDFSVFFRYSETEPNLAKEINHGPLPGVWSEADVP